jgi:hypothetical protein
VVAGDHHQLAVLGERRDGAAPRGGGLGDRERAAHPDVDQLGSWPLRIDDLTRLGLHLVLGGHGRGAASRPATIVPAALQNRISRSVPQPASRPWHSPPPNASPAPRPFTTVSAAVPPRYLPNVVTSGSATPVLGG